MTTNETNALSSTSNVTVNSTTSHTVRSVSAVSESAGVLGSARRSTGSGYITDEVKPTDIISINGAELTVAQAERYGLLKRDANGKLLDSSLLDADQRVKELGTPDRTPDDDTHSLEVDPVISETLGDWSGAIREFGGNPVAVIGAMVASPDVIPKQFMDMARAHGIPQDRIAADVQRVGAEVESALLRKAGVSVDQADEFWQFVRRSPSGSNLLSAINDALFTGRAGQFATWGRDFVTASNRPANPHAHVNARDMKVIKVRVGGQEITTDPVTARRKGWI